MFVNFTKATAKGVKGLLAVLKIIYKKNKYDNL